jgi:cytochrome P450
MDHFAPSDFSNLESLPVLGSIIPMSRDALGFFTRALNSHGDRVRMRILGRSVLLLCHPQDIEQVLVRDRDSYGRSVEIRKLKPIFGDGLVASEGELWRRQRGLLQPSFTHDALAKYASIMLSVIHEHLRQWQNNDVRDIHAEMMKYTRETICAVLFGEDFATEQNELGAAVSTVFGGLRSEVLYLPIWRRLPLKRSREWNRAVAILNSSISGAIRRRRKSPEDRSDLLGALLASRDTDGESMSDQQLHDEILTFFLAGHETAALGLTWALYLLAAHPEIQEHIVDEVRSVAQGEQITPEAYSKLHWTTAAVKEAMRLYPPSWSMGREATANTTLGGHPVKKGTDIWICLYQLHRDARWFNDPDAFLPERWLGNSSRKPFTYIPFGIGQRVCIGQHFAMMESVLGLAAILSQFRLTLNDSHMPALSAWITLRPQTPIRLQISRITDSMAYSMASSSPSARRQSTEP